jgi:hypothetical protein
MAQEIANARIASPLIEAEIQLLDAVYYSR